MVLIDTSVWVAHLREGNIGLDVLLNEGRVVGHPFVIGELACGNLRNRTEILSLLMTLPKAVQAEHDEVMELLEAHKLMGKGLGYIDVHLVASALLTDVPLWTLDRRLGDAVAKLDMKYLPSFS